MMTNRALLLDLPHLWVGGRRPSGPRHATMPSQQLLQEAQRHDGAGRMDEAIRWYDAAINTAEAKDNGTFMSTVGQDTDHVEP